MRLKTLSVCFLVSLLALPFACGKSSNNLSRSFSNDEWSQQKWISKASKILRFGKGITRNDPLERWLTTPRTQIIDELMASPEFENFLIDFHAYKLGFKVTDNTYLGYDFIAFSGAQVIPTAQAVLQNARENPFFKFDVPVYGTHPDVYDEDGNRLEGEQARAFRLSLRAEASTQIDALRKAVTEAPNYEMKRKIFCESDFTQKVNQMVDRYGTPFHISLESYSAIVEGAQFYCFGSRQDDVILSLLSDLESKLNGVLDYLDTVPIDKAVEESISDLYQYDAEKLLFRKNTILHSFQWLQLTNSSTNYNRKRAAYILRRYFCDDLSPINIQQSPDDDHTGGDRHASAPTCQGCHYKLDPMAGFFRNHGVQGFSFEAQSKIVFDDLATKSMDSYLKQWKATPQSGRIWEVGYIRSGDDPSENFYGESMSDLERIIQTSREAKQCYVKNLTQYIYGENQLVDAGYLSRTLTDEYISQETSEGFAVAFKGLVKKILLSETFAQEAPVASQCYDFPANTSADSRAPCQVAYLFEHNCKTCHSPAKPGGGFSSTEWIELPDGSHSFKHVKQGRQLSKLESLQEIYDRMTFADPDETPMPKGFITPQDREALVKWLAAEIARLKVTP